MRTNSGSLTGAVLLIAGSSIGGGMLALPVLTSLGGFIPSLFIYVLCCLFMMATGLLLLELSLTYGEGANLLTMAERTLGKWGKYVTWILYIFLFYCLTVAYMVGCGDILTNNFNTFHGPLLFTLLFAPFVWAGTRIVGPLNSFMMACLFALYLTFVIMGLPKVNPELLSRADWKMSLIALPIAFTSFAFQGIIPTLTSYLNFDAKRLRLSIILGCLIPLFTYALWQWLILGIIPVEGEHGLRDALANQDNAVTPLKYFLGNSFLWIVGEYFAFLAMLTSFLGVTLGLLDFLADGLNVKKNKRGRLLLCSLIFIPPLIIIFYNPDIFLKALGLAGGYGCALLLGLMPVLMVAVKRYRQHNFENLQLKGGKSILILLLLFIILELVIEWTT